MKENAFILYPRLKEEFDLIQNVQIDYITIGSNKKYWFNCSLCGKSYFNSVKNWIRIYKNDNKCKHMNYAPRKFKISLSLNEHSPHLLKEWNYKLNKFDPKDINYGSEKIAHWICDKCSSNYKTRIYKRTVDKSNCPYCNGKKVNNTNSLFIHFPELSKWLKNSQIATIVTPFSSKKAEWQCRKCFEYFKTTIFSMVNAYKKNKLGCPYCSGKKVNNNNNLLKTHPEICKEWNYNKNVKGPENYTAGSGSRSKVWWKCSNKHEWQASINVRTGRSKQKGSGCPFCCHKISYPEIAWLDSLNIIERQKTIYINGKRFKVDGFDSVNNTVYEFYGDYYHGNPKIYNPNDFNKTCKKTFGELYNKAMIKENILKLNYNVITIWENDWKNK